MCEIALNYDPILMRYVPEKFKVYKLFKLAVSVTYFKIRNEYINNYIPSGFQESLRKAYSVKGE